MPALIPEPQLVERTSQAPQGDSWLHEIKYDGYRLLASVVRGNFEDDVLPGLATGTANAYRDTTKILKL